MREFLHEGVDDEYFETIAFYFDLHHTLSTEGLSFFATKVGYRYLLHAKEYLNDGSLEAWFQYVEQKDEDWTKVFKTDIKNIKQLNRTIDKLLKVCKPVVDILDSETEVIGDFWLIASWYDDTADEIGYTPNNFAG